MPFNPDRHRRRSARLPGYDYTQTGAYFITICNVGRTCLFGRVEDDVMHTSDAGAAVAACWRVLPLHFHHIALDAFAVMPNHVHGIIVIRSDATGAGEKVITQRRPADGAMPGSIGAIIQNFKSVATRKVRQLSRYEGLPVWQRNHHEHIIRDDAALHALRHYIAENAARWAEDKENPAREQWT